MKKTESNEFAMRLIPSVMSMLLCLGLLCTTSLAYFTETVTSGECIIASASYETKVALLDIQQPASLHSAMSPQGPYIAAFGTQPLPAAGCGAHVCGKNRYR